MDIQPKISFEDNFVALEHLVEALEKGGLALEEAIVLYDRGMRLAKECNDQLEAAELKVTQLRAGFGGAENS
ncbi:MAG: exodeoxyribonuclease VII small subunit [Dehalococcoidia bacterium]|nr:exodeoxyribonuclease VII small subunit [Dehalococcoidia bacterium]